MLFLDLDKDSLTGGYQIAINPNEGTGFRIAGPKYSGNSRRLERHTITEYDAKVIREYLAREFPLLAVMYARDLDGTGSLHPCAKEDDGAVALYRGDE